MTPIQRDIVRLLVKHHKTWSRYGGLDANELSILLRAGSHALTMGLRGLIESNVVTSAVQDEPFGSNPNIVRRFYIVDPALKRGIDRRCGSG